jgi:hypothetical protein
MGCMGAVLHGLLHCVPGACCMSPIHHPVRSTSMCQPRTRLTAPYPPTHAASPHSLYNMPYMAAHAPYCTNQHPAAPITPPPHPPLAQPVQDALHLGPQDHRPSSGGPRNGAVLRGLPPHQLPPRGQHGATQCAAQVGGGAHDLGGWLMEGPSCLRRDVGCDTFRWCSVSHGWRRCS